MNPPDINVASFLDEIPSAGEVRKPVGARPPKMRYSHEAMADLVIARPEITQNEIAAIFGYTAPWVSTIMTSDAFKALLAKRREEVTNPALLMSLRERFEGVVTRSLQVMQEKLAKPTDAISDQFVLKAVEVGAKALGLGQAQQPVVVTTEERLAGLAHRLMALKGGAGAPVVDVESREVRV